MSLNHCLAVSLLSLSIATAQAEQPPPKLELKLSLSKSEIVQLEPIVLTISVQNVSKNPQEILYPSFDLDAQQLKIFVTTQAGKTSWLKSDIIACRFGTATVTLKPSEAIRYRLFLSGQPKGWMDTPGEYQLHITLSCLKKAKPLESKPVKLTVKAAEGIDKEALDRFRGYPQAIFLNRGSTDAAIAAQFLIVTQKYPKIAYTPWCYYILGWAMQNSHDAFASDALQADAVRDYYEPLLRKYPKFPLKTEIEYELARELLRTGEDEGAIEQIEELADKHSDLWLFRRVNYSLKHLQPFRDRARKIPAEELPGHHAL